MAAQSPTAAPPAADLDQSHAPRPPRSARTPPPPPDRFLSSSSSSPDLEPDKAESPPDDVDPLATDRLDPVHRIALIALALAYVGSLIPSFFNGPSLLVVAKDLRLGNERSWLSTSDGVATACIVPCVGYLQDLIGRRSLFAVGLLCTLVSAVVIATSHSFGQIVAGHVIAGLGSGIQELSATAAIAELVPRRSRGLYLGLTVGLTILFTPAVLYVDLLAEHATWRWLYWISLMWNGATVLLLAVTYFPMKQLRTAPKATLTSIREFDFVGVVLLIGGLVEILIALQAENAEHPWTSAFILVQLFVGILLIALFVLWESRGYGRPLVPFRLFQGQRVVGLTLVICFFSGIPYTSSLSLGTTIITEVFRQNGIQTGLIALGPSVALAVGAAASNILITTTKGHVREILVAAALIMRAEASIAPGKQVTWAILGTFGSLGIGGLLTPLSAVVTLGCPQDLIGTAVALTITIRTIGGTVGYAILFNIYNSQVDGGAHNPTKAARLVFLVTMAFCVVPLVLSACLPNMRRYMKGRALTRMTTRSLTM